MKPLSSLLFLPALLAGICLAPGRAGALEGRYTGTITRFEGVENVDNTLHHYDLSTAKSFSNSLELDLRASLRYQARLGEAHSELFGSRFNGDLRSTIWRLRADWTPWQNLSAGAAPPRGRNANLAFNLSPQRLPQLNLGYSRGDDRSFAGRSMNEDRRAGLSFTRGLVTAAGSYRRVDRSLRDSSVPGARTDEWKTGASITPTWRKLSFRSAWEYLSSRYRSAARRRDIDTHSLDLNGSWQPLRQFNVGATGLARFGKTSDNAAPRRDADERSYGGRADYRPRSWLDFQVGRDYHRSALTDGDAVSDYGHFQATCQRRFLRRLSFQTGYQKYVDFADNNAVPADNVYALVDGPVRRSLSARFEARAATSGVAGVGRQWRQVAQLRGDPIPEMHLEATYRHDALPDSGGPGLVRNEWSTTTSFSPESAIGLIANVKWQTSHGRVESEERLANLLLTWRSTDRSHLSLDWSHRSATANFIETTETIYGLDLETWLPGDYRVIGSTRESGVRGRVRNRSYTLTLEKSF